MNNYTQVFKSIDPPARQKPQISNLREWGVDVFLICLVTALVFGLAYHPYFFGDELMAHRAAIEHNYSFREIFRDLNKYKPRLVFNAILSLLAGNQLSRFWHAALVAGCMAWINILLYGVVRYSFNASRSLALLLVATTLTSRYGVMLYFDYVSGLIETLSTALLLTALMFAWLAQRGPFRPLYAVSALGTAILCVFVHERYAAGLLATGFAVVLFEYFATRGKRRLPVAVWGLSIGVIPLGLFWLANARLGALPITTGTAGQVVGMGWDTLWSAITYMYNVFLGGNYGHEWFWGNYNHTHDVGGLIGLSTVACTGTVMLLMCWQKGAIRKNDWLAASVMLSTLGLIAVASLTGLTRQEARFMFPVGILVAMIWIIYLKNPWRYIGILLILFVNVINLSLNSYSSVANVSASRTANLLSTSLLGVVPAGRNGIILGTTDSLWVLGGTDEFDTFAKVNLKSSLHISPYIPGNFLNAEEYDFGLFFNGLDANRVSSYRMVSLSDFLILNKISKIDDLPTKKVIGNLEQWSDWTWTKPPNRSDGAIALQLGMDGWRAMPSDQLHGHWLVYRARTKLGAHVPLRLQVNWHVQKDNTFLSTTIDVAYPDETWRTYATFLRAPARADIGYVYLTLHDKALNGDEVEVMSVELK